MIARREFAKLPVINSQGPMPHHSHFRYKDQVLVRFISGWYTLGTVIEQSNHWKLGADKLKYLYYRDVRHSHCLLLAGQGCECPAKGGHKEGCKLVNSGMRVRMQPITGVPAVTGTLTMLPMAPGAPLIAVNGSIQAYPATQLPPGTAKVMPTMPWTGTGKPRKKPQYRWRRP